MADAIQCDVCGGFTSRRNEAILRTKVVGGQQYLGGTMARTTFDICSWHCLRDVPPGWVPSLTPTPLKKVD